MSTISKVVKAAASLALLSTAVPSSVFGAIVPTTSPAPSVPRQPASLLNMTVAVPESDSKLSKCQPALQSLLPRVAQGVESVAQPDQTTIASSIIDAEDHQLTNTTEPSIVINTDLDGYLFEVTDESTPEPTAESEGKGCFALNDSTVEVLDGNDDVVEIQLKDLQEGDQVVVSKKDGAIKTQPFTGAYFHRNPNDIFEFVTLKAGNVSLTITPNHYVESMDSDGNLAPKMAGELRVGDTLVQNGNLVEISEINAEIEQKGAVSPQLNEGFLQVNGFNVSTYAGLFSSGQDIFGYDLTTKAVDAASTLTKAVYSESAVKVTQDNGGVVELVGQKAADRLL